MKEKFKGYYKLTQKRISGIWDKGFISIDVNVLLNLYRYSDDTSKELLLKIEKYSEKLWLTYHATYEFQKNRVGVISDQVKIYEDTIKEFDKLEDNIIKNLKSPHLSGPIQRTFKKSILAIKKDLEKRKIFYLKLLNNDTILSKVTKIFSKKITTQPGSIYGSPGTVYSTPGTLYSKPNDFFTQPAQLVTHLSSVDLIAAKDDKDEKSKEKK